MTEPTEIPQPQDDNAAAAFASLETGAAAEEGSQAATAEPAKAGELVDDCSAEAELIVSGIATALQEKWPALNYPDQAKQAVAEKLARVLEKYNFGSMFGAKWREEIELGITVVVIGWKSWKTVQAEKAQGAQNADQ